MGLYRVEVQAECRHECDCDNCTDREWYVMRVFPETEALSPEQAIADAKERVAELLREHRYTGLVDPETSDMPHDYTPDCDYKDLCFNAEAIPMPLGPMAELLGVEP